MKVYNPFFDEKMAPTKKGTGGRKSASKPTKKKEAAPLSAEAAAGSCRG